MKKYLLLIVVYFLFKPTDCNAQLFAKISGKISSASGNVTNAKVFLLPINNIDSVQQTSVDTAGNYVFNTVPGGAHRLEVFPDVPTYPMLLKTYYGNVVLWGQADTIQVNTDDSIVANINVLSIPPLAYGTGSISGVINLDASYVHKTDIIGDPVPGVDVYLEKVPSGIVVARAVTDSTGYYQFTYVPDDSYVLSPNVTGFLLDSTYSPTIDANTTAFSHLNYFMSDTSIYPNVPPPCIITVDYSLYKDVQPLTWAVVPVYNVNISSAKWSWGDGTDTVGFYPSHAYAAAGSYNICVTAYIYCGDSAVTCHNDSVYKTNNGNMIRVNVVQNTPTSIKSISSSNSPLLLFPNPVTNVLTLSGVDAGASVNILDVLGNVVYQSKNITPSETIDLTGVSCGVYFIQVGRKDKVYTSKFLKE